MEDDRTHQTASLESADGAPKKNKSLHLRKLFGAEPKRGQRMTVEGAGLFLDYSKNRIIDQTIKLLLQLANVSCLRERIDAMFAYSTVALTSVHLKSSAPLREEDTVISGP